MLAPSFFSYVYFLGGFASSFNGHWRVCVQLKWQYFSRLILLGFGRLFPLSQELSKLH